MAKVTGPLMSMDARGKLGNALVFIGWKGIKSVRQYLKPAQPNSTGQGDVRTILGGLGRAAKAVQKESPFYADAKAIAPAQQSWISNLVSYLRSTYMSTTANFEAMVTEYETHTAKASFDSNAVTLGLAEFAVSYRGTTEVFAAGLELYMLAKFGVAQRALDGTKFNRAPYTDALASWDGADVTAFVADLAV